MKVLEKEFRQSVELPANFAMVCSIALTRKAISGPNLAGRPTGWQAGNAGRGSRNKTAGMNDVCKIKSVRKMLSEWRKTRLKKRF